VYCPFHCSSDPAEPKISLLGRPEGLDKQRTIVCIRTFIRILQGVEILIICIKEIGFGGLEVACWPLVPKFAGSNPAEAVGFLRAKKSSARLPSEGK